MSRAGSELSSTGMRLAFLAVLYGCGLCGCSQKQNDSADGVPDQLQGYASRRIQFLDTADSQTVPDVGLYDLMLTAADGQQTSVRDLGENRNVVLIVTRGNTTPICPYCSTQTAHYIRDYEQFEERNAEVVVVYPVEAKGDQRKLNSFLADARGRLVDPNRAIPFPVVFDVELTAVNRLGIREDLSKPATYIISPDGQVLYAYVGAHWGDRPSTEVILNKLDGFQATGNSQDVSSDES